jgi:DNA-directed RNA polymerase subunit M/transcription elongation factor TFIIS
VHQRIPIETSEFHCPSCNERETLEYLLQRIAEGPQGFEFEVVIQCKRCSKKRSMKKLLKSLMEVVKLEIKPTGITLKKG